jgi:hypothetical protein
MDIDKQTFANSCSGSIPVYRDDRADTGQQTAKKRSECDKPLAGAVGN